MTNLFMYVLVLAAFIGGIEYGNDFLFGFALGATWATTVLGFIMVFVFPNIMQVAYTKLCAKHGARAYLGELSSVAFFICLSVYLAISGMPILATLVAVVNAKDFLIARRGYVAWQQGR